MALPLPGEGPPLPAEVKKSARNGGSKRPVAKTRGRPTEPRKRSAR